MSALKKRGPLSLSASLRVTYPLLSAISRLSLGWMQGNRNAKQRQFVIRPVTNCFECLRFWSSLQDLPQVLTSEKEDGCPAGYYCQEASSRFGDATCLEELVPEDPSSGYVDPQRYLKRKSPMLPDMSPDIDEYGFTILGLQIR